jgi:tetratricopeptide (TPR) repeat protein
MNELIYRPQHKPEEELKDDFVIRIMEFDKLMSSIKADRPKLTPQHIILQGKRGMGKTTLMYRVYYQVVNEYRSNGLVPVIFSEEQYSVRTLYKLWEQIARFLEDNEPDYSGVWYQMQDIQDHTDYEEKCFELLRESIKDNDHRILLLIDNFGVMVDKFSKQEQQRFREILTTFPNLKIIGGSAVVLESFYKYDKPFFDFFKVIQLEPLKSKEVRTLLLRLGEKYKTNKVKDIIEQQPGRIESMRVLTGGVPRTIVLLFNIFLDTDHGNSIEDLKSLLDMVTPLYKHRMDELPPQQQEIVDKLALNWDGMSVAELVSKTRMESKALSAQLNNLVKSGVAHTEKSTGKNKYYQLEERFFNIWYLMQHAPKRMQQKVIWLTRFLEYWCPGGMLEEEASAFAKRLEIEVLHPEYIQTMTYAYSRANGLPLEVRDYIIETADRALKLISPKNSVDLPIQYGKFSKLVSDLLDDNQFAKVLNVIEDASFPAPLTNALTGVVYESSGNLEGAIDKYLKAIELEDIPSMAQLGRLYENYYQDYDNSAKYYQMAINHGFHHVNVDLGNLSENKLKDFATAENFYKDAVKNGVSTGLIHLGWLYFNQYKEFEKAEEYFLEAIKNNIDSAFSAVAIVYHTKLKHLKKAEEYYLQAIQKKDVNAFFGMTVLVIDHNWTHYEEKAGEWIDFCVEHRLTDVVQLLRVRYLLWINKPKEASGLLLESITIESDNDGYDLLLGDILSFSISKGLKQFILKLFQRRDQHQLKDRYKVIYYALMTLLVDEYPNEIKKMGKELEEPVAQMVAYIKEMEEKYNS